MPREILYGFLNLLFTALKEIHRGTHRPYPCGAGAGYVAAAADEYLYACHRFVGDEQASMGSIDLGVDARKQSTWLSARHVHRQQPCGSCWARYLCGGGCHHEVLGRGRVACDYIRGWLTYCLEAYVRLLKSRPDLFRLRLPDRTRLQVPVQSLCRKPDTRLCQCCCNRFCLRHHVVVVEPSAESGVRGDLGVPDAEIRVGGIVAQAVLTGAPLNQGTRSRRRRS